MDCNETGSRIPSYLDGTLSEEDLEGFIAHVRHCKSCMDDLQTAFLVDRAVKSLNENEDFSLNAEEELERDLSRREHGIYARRRNRRLFYAVVWAAEIAVLLLLFSRLFPGAI